MREGRDSVTLTCEADSNPAPTFIWVRGNGLGEVGRGPVLSLSPASRTDIDTYTCIASNSLGSSTPQSVDVDVYCEFTQLYSIFYWNRCQYFLMFSVIPNVTITPTAPAPAPLIEGRDSLVLDCEVDSNPLPAISWYKDIQTDGSGVPRLQVMSGLMCVNISLFFESRRFLGALS